VLAKPLGSLASASGPGARPAAPVPGAGSVCPPPRLELGVHPLLSLGRAADAVCEVAVGRQRDDEDSNRP
jgi:hypothetical protein